MRRLIVGSIPLIASIVVPATFQGSLYLIVLWLLMGLAGLYLIVTSEPVKKPLLARLRSELELPAQETREQVKTRAVVNLKRAVAEISEELEAAEGVLSGPRMDKYFVSHELETEKWQRFGTVIALSDPSLHKMVRAAYRSIDALNNRGITRGLMTTRSGPTTDVNSTLADQARESIKTAIEMLDSYFLPY